MNSTTPSFWRRMRNSTVECAPSPWMCPEVGFWVASIAKSFVRILAAHCILITQYCVSSYSWKWMKNGVALIHKTFCKCEMFCLKWHFSYSGSTKQASLHLHQRCRSVSHYIKSKQSAWFYPNRFLLASTPKKKVLNNTKSLFLV